MARYYTAMAGPIQAEGIKPDIIVKPVRPSEETGVSQGGKASGKRISRAHQRPGRIPMKNKNGDSKTTDLGKG